MVTNSATPPPVGPSPASGMAAGAPTTGASATASAGTATTPSPTPRGGPSFATTLKDRFKRTSSFGTVGGTGASCTTRDTTTGGSSTVDAGTPVLHANKDDLWSLLLVRCRAWKQLVKNLTVYFNIIADVQEAAARGYAKAATVLVSPQSHAGGHFIEVQDPAKRSVGETPGGILAVLHDLHHTTRLFAEADARSCNALVDTAINSLDRLKKQIKLCVDELTNDSRSSATQMERVRELTKKKFIELGKAIETHKHQPGVNCLDPWLANHGVRVQLNNQLNAERDYHAAAALALHAFADFEKSTIVHDVRMALSSFVSNYGSTTPSGAAEVQAAVKAMQVSVENLKEDAEWNAFVERNDAPLALVRETIPALEDVPYEHRDHELCRTVRHGALERKRFGGWTQEVWVLTAGGWMHSFATCDLLSHATPEKSIYVAGSQLHSSPALSENQPREFSLLEKGKGGAFHMSDHRYRLRAANHEDAASWWNALSEFARPPAFSETQRPSGTIAGENPKVDHDKEAAREEIADGSETMEEHQVEGLGVHEGKGDERKRFDSTNAPRTQAQRDGEPSVDGEQKVAGAANFVPTAEPVQQPKSPRVGPAPGITQIPESSSTAESPSKLVTPPAPSDAPATIPAEVTATAAEPAR